MRVRRIFCLVYCLCVRGVVDELPDVFKIGYSILCGARALFVE